MEKLIGHVVDGGVDAILVAGTTGKFACLSDKQWADLVTTSLSVNQGTVPAIVNVSHCGTEEAIRRTDYATAAGADYVTATPPYFFPLGDDELLSYYRRLADVSRVPLLLYNIPQNVKTDISRLIDALADHPNIAGIKDSSGRCEHLVEINQRRPGRLIRLVGTDVLVTAAGALGMEGVVPGMANVTPRLYHDWWQAIEDGDAEMARRCEAKVAALVSLYSGIVGTAPYIPMLHFALQVLGIDVGPACEPASPLTPYARELVEQTLDELGLRL